MVHIKCQLEMTLSWIESLAMPEAVPVSGRVRNLKGYGHVNKVSHSQLEMTAAGFLFFFFFFFFFYCSTKYTAYMNLIIYIHTISIQRIKKHYNNGLL